MYKKGQGLALGAIILIVLGIAVLVFLIFGFSTGWNKLGDKTDSFNGESNVNDIKMTCEITCSSKRVYDYCEKIRGVDFGDGDLVEGNCKYFENDDRFGLDVCDIDCNGVSDEGVLIRGKVVDGVTGDPLRAFLWGINFDSSSRDIYSEEDGLFEISLDTEEGVWWFETNCYRNSFYSPEPSYIKILDRDESGFLLKAPNYEKRILFNDFEDGKISVDVGDFPIYPSWSIHMRSVGEDVVFIFNYVDKDGEIEGFPHGEAVSGLEKPYIVPVGSDFYVSAIESNGDIVNSEIQRISFSDTDYIDCGLIDVLYSPDEDSFKWTLTKEKTYWIRKI